MRALLLGMAMSAAACGGNEFSSAAGQHSAGNAAVAGSGSIPGAGGSSGTSSSAGVSGNADSAGGTGSEFGGSDNDAGAPNETGGKEPSEGAGGSGGKGSGGSSLGARGGSGGGAGSNVESSAGAGDDNAGGADVGSTGGNGGVAGSGSSSAGGSGIVGTGGAQTTELCSSRPDDACGAGPRALREFDVPSDTYCIRLQSPYDTSLWLHQSKAFCSDDAPPDVTFGMANNTCKIAYGPSGPNPDPRFFTTLFHTLSDAQPCVTFISKAQYEATPGNYFCTCL